LDLGLGLLVEPVEVDPELPSESDARQQSPRRERVYSLALDAEVFPGLARGDETLSHVCASSKRGARGGFMLSPGPMTAKN
jgi:hypothetical protein